jgi:hypothetical protein
MELFCVVDLSLSRENLHQSGFLTLCDDAIITVIILAARVVCSLGKPASFLFPG